MKRELVSSHRPVGLPPTTLSSSSRTFTGPSGKAAYMSLSVPHPPLSISAGDQIPRLKTAEVDIQGDLYTPVQHRYTFTQVYRIPGQDVRDGHDSPRSTTATGYSHMVFDVDAQRNVGSPLHEPVLDGARSVTGSVASVPDTHKKHSSRRDPTFTYK